MSNHDNLLTVICCQNEDCQSKIGIDYESEQLETISTLFNGDILTCPECYSEIYEDTHDSDYSDIHPNETIEDFSDSYNYDD